MDLNNLKMKNHAPSSDSPTKTKTIPGEQKKRVSFSVTIENVELVHECCPEQFLMGQLFEALISKKKR